MLEKSRFEKLMERTRWLRWIQFAIAITVFCYAALSPTPPLIDKHSATSLHFVGNILLCLSAWLAVWGRLSIFHLLAGLLIFSVAIEFAQHFSPGRVVDFKDMAVNLSGIGIGAVFVVFFQMAIKRALR